MEMKSKEVFEVPWIGKVMPCRLRRCAWLHSNLRLLG